MNTKSYFVYIMANKQNGTLYTGVSNNLVRRVYEHKHNLIAGFTQKYGVHLLVYFEMHTDVSEAIAREKRIKSWKRSWKLDLIERDNSTWRDLYEDLLK